MKQRDKYIQRELNGECLSCGKSIREKIKKGLKIHLCEQCAQFYINKK